MWYIGQFQGYFPSPEVISPGTLVNIDSGSGSVLHYLMKNISSLCLISVLAFSDRSISTLAVHTRTNMFAKSRPHLKLQEISNFLNQCWQRCDCSLIWLSLEIISFVFSSCRWVEWPWWDQTSGWLKDFSGDSANNTIDIIDCVNVVMVPLQWWRYLCPFTGLYLSITISIWREYSIHTHNLTSTTKNKSGR